MITVVDGLAATFVVVLPLESVEVLFEIIIEVEVVVTTVDD